MKEFGHKVPVRDKAGEIVSLKERPAVRVTRQQLGHSFGCDWERKLVVSLHEGDLVIFRPAGTRRPLTMSAMDLYRYAVRCEANRLTLERARDLKAKKAQRLADQRQRRAEKRLFKK